ncbi:two-component system sensor histidine kinase DcuS [Pluralibacter gergoviae]
MSNATSPAAQQKPPMKLGTRVSLMVCGVVGAVLLLVWSLWLVQIGHATRDGVKETALAVARTLADSPEVRRGLTLPPRNNPIQSLTEAVRQRNDLLFAVVTDMRGVRYSHPNRQIIGQRFIGDDLTPALAGRENVSVNHGVLAQALRVFTPIYDDQHRQIGVVVVGISLAKVDEQVSESRWSMLWSGLFGVLAGALGIAALVRVLKRLLLGLEPWEITMLFKQRQAMLQSLREGVIAVDAKGRMTVINHAARKMLLSAPEDHAGEDAGQRMLLDTLREVLASGRPLKDLEMGCNGRLLLCNIAPVRSQGATIGAISTFRDKTEVSQLLQRLDGMVNYVDALRTTSHEFMNKLHVILGLLSMKSYDQLERYVLQTAETYQSDIGAIQHQIKSPVVAGFLLGKISRAKSRGARLNIAAESRVPENANEKQVTVLVTVLGNLIENALDAMGEAADGEISVLLHYQNGWLSGEVSDDGPGISAEHIDAIFAKGFSTKGENRGVGLFLASQQLSELGGTITVESEPGVFTQFFVHLPWDSERKRA